MYRRITHEGMHDGRFIVIGEKYVSNQFVATAWVDGVEAIGCSGLNAVLNADDPLEAMKQYIDHQTGLYPPKPDSKRKFGYH